MAYFSVVLAIICVLGNLECSLGDVKVWPTLSLPHAPYFAEVFLCLGLHMLHVISRTVQYVLQFGIKQKAPNNTLDCLKGVITKKAQVGCDQALS